MITMTTDFTTTPPEERELTILERLLLEHMKTIGNQLKLLGKITLLEERISKLELTVEAMSNSNVWEVYSDDKQSNVETKFFS